MSGVESTRRDPRGQSVIGRKNSSTPSESSFSTPCEAESKSAEAKPRQRREHTRSRAGCTSCKKRHVRCDEGRPACIKCLTSGQSCIYPPMRPSTRELRAGAGVPGVQEPWVVTAATTDTTVAVINPKPTEAPISVTWQVPGSVLDPFNSLPIEMPGKSRALFHYFARVTTATKDSPQTKIASPDIISIVTEPTAFRMFLMFAGMHYHWDAGALFDYQDTVASHNGESIQVVKTWLTDNAAWMDDKCLRLVVTLCITESVLGNIFAANAHLAGVSTLVDMRNKRRQEISEDLLPEEEMTERYVVIIYHFVGAILSRIRGAPFIGPAHQAVEPGPIVEDSTHIMSSWRYNDISSITLSLEIMRMMANFCQPGADGRPPRPVDALPMMEVMRDITALMDRQSLEPHSPMPKHGVWTCGQVHLYETLQAHVRSYADRSSGDNNMRPVNRSSPWMCSWLGFTSVSHLYYYSVMHLQHAERPVLRRMVLQLLAILDRDIRKIEAATWSAEVSDRVVRDFWFWKVFVGAFTIAKVEREGVVEAEDPALRALRSSFHRSLRRWRDETKARWEDARMALKRIVWPSAYLRPGTAEAVWVDVLVR